MRVAYEAFKNGEGAGKIQASAPADGAGQNFYALLYTGLYYEAEVCGTHTHAHVWPRVPPSCVPRATCARHARCQRRRSSCPRAASRHRARWMSP